MKTYLFILSMVITISCNQPVNDIPTLQNRIDSLEKKVADAYKPGLGEFMIGLQLHHQKLWMAGQNGNWKLAVFEMDEMKETLENIQKYAAERKESKMITILKVPLDSLTQAIREKNTEAFKTGFILLTGTCNNCHRENDFEFNVVKIPVASSFPNQDFTSQH